jgi:hypothetical protein
MPKPKGDLASLVVPKAAAAAIPPHANQMPEAPAAAGSSQAGALAKALTVKVDPDSYWRLQRYCMERGQREGRRVTHQEIMVEALLRLLDERAR